MRYGLVAIGALSLLSLVHWVRDRQLLLEPVSAYLVGVVPNFAAAIAIRFVLLSIWTGQLRNPDFRAARNRFFTVALISGLGLVGWELFQITSSRLVFDTHDLLATLVGIGTAALLFYTITPQPPPRVD